MRFYAGIGSRETPTEIQERMKQIAATLATHNFCLRSGAAQGADAAFESGVPASQNGSVLKEIYLPWPKFNYHATGWTKIPAWAVEMAEEFHPAWNYLSTSVRKLMARNSMQIFGYTRENPSEFVLYWTPCGKQVGGTAQALRIAAHYKIPCYWVDSPSWELPEGII